MSNRNNTVNNRRRRAIQNNNRPNVNRQMTRGQRRALNFLPNGMPRRQLPRRNPRTRNVNRNNRNQSGPMFDPPLNRYSSPSQQTSNNQSRIVHREPLMPLIGSQAFNITTFSLNPGLATTFPWLSNQALGYESYKVNALHVQYRHTTNEFTGKGTIVIAPDYDAADSPPTSIVQAEQMADSVQGACTRDWTCILRPRGIGILGPKRYTRSGALAANEDIKTYDIAQIHICTSGQADDTAEIGQLWIYYDITLSEPQPPSVPNIFLSGSFYNANGAGVLITDILGTGVSEGSLSVTTDGANSVHIDGVIPGYAYRIYAAVMAGTNTTQMTLTATSGGTFDVVAISSVSSLVTTKNVVSKLILATGPVITIAMGGVTVLTNPSAAVFEISGAINPYS